MTNNQSTILSISEQRRLKAVEMDVRWAMLEAGCPGKAEADRAIRKHRSRVLLANQIARLLTCFICISLAGCGLLGVRKVDAWGLEMEFAEGLDFSVGANSVDNVQNARGVNPISSYSQQILPNPKGRY